MTTSEILQANQREAILAIFRAILPPERIGTTEWANKYRYFHPTEGATQGKYDCSQIPYLTWKGNPHEALDDRKTHEVCCQKSAQVAWTTGVSGNYIGMRITHEPSPMLIIFPKEGAAKDWNREKLVPMIEATPILSEKINLKSKSNTWGHKEFEGGFLKAVGSNSASSVKSSPIPIIIIEEPDDCNQNLGGQGDSIALGKERAKSFKISLGQVKFIIGGTPTIKKFSTIEREMELSDKRVGMVQCHECLELAPLSFDNFMIPEEEGLEHLIFGNKNPDKAFYACPKCGCAWSFREKNRNLYREANHWLATAKFNGIAGFYLNELYSKFEGSSFKILAEKYLTALYEFKELGKPEKLIAFINSSKGEAYEYLGESKDANELEEHGKDYQLGEVPFGGVVLTCGVDVQIDRLEVLVRAWGSENRSWLVERFKIEGDPTDSKDKCWVDLYNVLKKKYKAGDKYLLISSMSVDSGFSSEQIYDFIRKCNRNIGRRAIAVKGSSEVRSTQEIYSRPRAIDSKTRGRKTKSDTAGVQVYMVGTNQAKTLIDALLGLAGKPTERFFWSKHVDEDYLKELTSEVLAPNRSNRLVWQRKAGFNAEALDCEVYALHSAYHLGLHKKEDQYWKELEAKIYGKARSKERTNKGTTKRTKSAK